MKKLILIFLGLILIISLTLADSNIWATNGAQMIGVGPVSRAMGGTGIANPQDGVSAIYLNPAGMIYYNKLKVDFGATLFKPSIDSAMTAGPTPTTGSSRYRPFPMPAIAVIFPINDNINFGFAAVGVGGQGTDYRNSKLSSFSHIQLTQMDFIPALSIKLMGGMLGIGISLPFSYQTLDMGDANNTNDTGVDHAFGLSAKLGATINIKIMKFGIYFKTPPLLTPEHEVGQPTNAAGNPSTRMKIASPMEIGLGASLTMIENLVVSLNGKYIFWDSAKGYGDPASFTAVPYGFDWKNQFVIALGFQYANIAKILTLRAGYNFGNDVTRDGGQTNLNSMFNLRAPAVVEHHITLGVGVDVGKDLQLNFGFVYALKGKAEGTVDSAAFGMAPGTAIPLKSEMSQFSLDFGISNKF